MPAVAFGVSCQWVVGRVNKIIHVKCWRQDLVQSKFSAVGGSSRGSRISGDISVNSILVGLIELKTKFID